MHAPAVSSPVLKLAHEQPAHVLHTMLLLYVALPIIIWGCGLVFVWLYPLNRENMAVIRIRLEARRGKI